ncbi:MAG: hypothetical protein JWL97_4546 [Gemmatimonadales bacterium]|nr:hypothetical protein [Gemmatimonadales bacterium]
MIRELMWRLVAWLYFGSARPPADDDAYDHGRDDENIAHFLGASDE